MHRILLIDDNPKFRAMLHNTLKTSGYEVLDAQDGNAAIALYSQSPIDLVITDLVMPEKEGLETIMELRRVNPAVKIIAISGGGQATPIWKPSSGLSRPSP